MRHRRLPGLVLAAALWAGPLLAQGLKRETVDRLKAATVFIQVSQRDYLSGAEGIASGSGFFLHANGFVVTNWHVVRPFGTGFLDLNLPRELTRIRVFIGSGTLNEEVVDAAVVAVDKEADLAILATPKRAAVCLEPSPVAELLETSPLWVAGFPLGEKFAIIERGPEVTLGRGTVTALRHDDQGRLQVIQTDAPFDSGNSGGPLTDAEGRVLGVAQSIVVNNRSLNFAVPIAAASALLAQARPAQPQPARGKVTFCASPDAELYLDGQAALGEIDAAGRTFEVPLGLHQITVVSPDLPVWVRELPLAAGDRITANLSAERQLRINARPFGAPAPPVPPPAARPAVVLGDVLLAEDFADRAVLKKLEQATGGLRVNTWYVRDGQLHQHESNGLLHASYLGAPAWQDYAFSADVTIKNAARDARAGLIVREDARGFYLFRIHRETNKAQFAYHTKQPFGWFILGERQLGEDIAAKPNRLTVLAAGDRFTCLLNDQPVFQVCDQLADRGRVGFYSVDSQAAFDNAEVRAITAAPGAAGQGRPDAYSSFWFTDTFSENSAWWTAQLADGAPAPPWVFTDAGAVNADAADRERLALLDRYTLTNFMADLVVKLGTAKGGVDGQFGFIFGSRDEHGTPCDYRLCLAAREGQCRLIERRGDRVETLATADVSFATELTDRGQGSLLFGAPISRLLLRVDGNVVELGAAERRLLRYEFKNGTVPAGRFGLLSRGIKLILHQLTLASPRPLAETVAPDRDDEPAADEPAADGAPHAEGEPQR